MSLPLVLKKGHVLALPARHHQDVEDEVGPFAPSP